MLLGFSAVTPPRNTAQHGYRIGSYRIRIGRIGASWGWQCTAQRGTKRTSSCGSFKRVLLARSGYNDGKKLRTQEDISQSHQRRFRTLCMGTHSRHASDTGRASLKADAHHKVRLLCVSVQQKQGARQRSVRGRLNDLKFRSQPRLAKFQGS